MIDPITLQIPSVIEFGTGKRQSLVQHLSASRRIFFLVDLPVLKQVESLITELRNLGKTIEVSTDSVPEPPFEALENLMTPARKFNPDTVVGIGGGSTLDLAKLVAVLFSGKQKGADIVGIGNVRERKARLMLLPTTSGTGSEVTPIAVLTDSQAKLKKGIISSYLVCDVAIVDPELSLSLPGPVTAATGMDALTHCIEAFTNRHAHPVVDRFALAGIDLIVKNLEIAVTQGNNLEARTAMSLGSMYGGLCLGPVNTAATHALAYPLGGEFKITHGLANAMLLPYVMHFNLYACADKYAILAKSFDILDIGDDMTTAGEVIKKIQQLAGRCGIPASLEAVNIPETAVPEMAKAAMNVKRLLDNNPRLVTLEDAETIFYQAFRGKIAWGDL